MENLIQSKSEQPTVSVEPATSTPAPIAPVAPVAPVLQTDIAHHVVDLIVEIQQAIEAKAYEISVDRHCDFGTALGIFQEEKIAQSMIEYLTLYLNEIKPSVYQLSDKHAESYFLK